MGRVLFQKGCLQSGWEACWALSQLNSRTLRQGKDEWVHGPQKWGCNFPAGSGLGGAGMPRKSHGERSLVGYSLWSQKESDTTEHACL